ncbi:hypothetical protein [Bythopirellula polymerisocia]|uniref:Uncharacterized protein n=1 Tax=Bythopirellula polymerisocia TaxID=2528003 RepID=A0A5C6D5K5_9BACT|nr:hypothetical protein [Bythopirellula polymerisocia]TWU30179.1 hypothetical protein Pla144_09650 [Bythopirellula polymerisocia]
MRQRLWQIGIRGTRLGLMRVCSWSLLWGLLYSNLAVADIAITLSPYDFEYSSYSGYRLDVPWFLPKAQDITIRFVGGAFLRTTAESHFDFDISNFGRNEKADRTFGILDADGNVLMSDSVYDNTIASYSEGHTLTVPAGTDVFGLFFSVDPDLQIGRSDTEVQFRIPPSALLIPALAGDFNFDGRVDDIDLEWWLNANPLYWDGDADGDRDTDGRDFLIWQRQNGQGTAPTNSIAVPEPGSTVLLSLLLVCISRRIVGNLAG